MKFPGIWLSCIILFGITGTFYAQEKTAQNVLFIAVDDLNTSLGCYGSTVITPNLDSLAQSGLLFKRAYCQEAVCAPSRASVLSGYRPDEETLRIGRGSGGGPKLRENAPEVITLPELFQKYGYHTVSIGKIFHHGEVETAEK